MHLQIFLLRQRAKGSRKLSSNGLDSRRMSANTSERVNGVIGENQKDTVQCSRLTLTKKRFLLTSIFRSLTPSSPDTISRSNQIPTYKLYLARPFVSKTLSQRIQDIVKSIEWSVSSPCFWMSKVIRARLSLSPRRMPLLLMNDKSFWHISYIS